MNTFVRTTEETERLIESMGAYARLKLAENSHKPHWLDESEEKLVDKLMGEFGEFMMALCAWKISQAPAQMEALHRKAGDVHNAIEMLVDWQARHQGESPNCPPITIDPPWLRPNEHGELPGDICCMRSGPCYEHNSENYMFADGEWVLK